LKYYTRRWVKPNDLNGANRLFGGQLLAWIDEEAAIYAACQMKHERTVTKYVSEIDFKRPASVGDIVEFGLEVVGSGRTSITLSCDVRIKNSRQSILTIDRMVFVAVDKDGTSTPHGYGVEHDENVAV